MALFDAELKRQLCGLTKIWPGVGGRMVGGVFITPKGFLQAAALSTCYPSEWKHHIYKTLVCFCFVLSPPPLCTCVFVYPRVLGWGMYTCMHLEVTG